MERLDKSAGTLTIAQPKEGKPKAIRLGPPALVVLNELPRLKSNPYIIAGRRKGQPLVGLQHVWQRIRAAAQLDDVRIHDLRHGFASTAAAGGSSLPIIGALLGHRVPSTTARYAHLGDDPLRAVADRVSAELAQAMARRSHPRTWRRSDAGDARDPRRRRLRTLRRRARGPRRHPPLRRRRVHERPA